MAEPGRGGGLDAVVTMRHRTAERRDHRAEHRSCSAIVAGAQNVAALQDLVMVTLLSLFLFHCSRMVVMWQVWRGPANQVWRMTPTPDTIPGVAGVLSWCSSCLVCIFGRDRWRAHHGTVPRALDTTSHVGWFFAFLGASSQPLRRRSRSSNASKERGDLRARGKKKL